MFWYLSRDSLDIFYFVPTDVSVFEIVIYVILEPYIAYPPYLIEGADHIIILVLESVVCYVDFLYQRLLLF